MAVSSRSSAALTRPPRRGNSRTTPSSPAKDGHLDRLRAGRDPGWWFGLLLVAGILVAYLPAVNGKFIWDDDAWTTQISGLLQDLSGLRTIWLHPKALQQYYPLTATTFWIDHHLWGQWTLPYHVENLLLHAFSTMLFWRLLRRLEVPGGWLAAAVFALHPLMVESVAWITERKNTLSLVFFLGALLAYGRFTRFWAQAPDPGVAKGTRQRPWHYYGWSLVLFLAALFAKTTTVTLPAVLLLICWWKRGRVEWRRDVQPTLPFFALAAALSANTYWLERSNLGASGGEWSHTFAERCLIAGRAVWFYAGKLYWPADLCFVYPQWRLDVGSLVQWTYPATAIALLIVLWLARDRIGRGPAAAALYFVGTLFPVLGFMNAYFMRYSYVCDHWSYLPSLGLIALTGAVLVQIVGRLRTPGVLIGLAAVILPVLSVLTWRRSGTYTDIETLWQTTLARNPDCWMAHGNLGLFCLRAGRVDEAVAHFNRILEIRPGNADAYIDLGVAFLQKGESNEAIAHLDKAVELRPGDADAHYHLGVALLQEGRTDQAIVHFRQTLKARPSDADAHTKLGIAFLQAGQVDEAVAHLQEVLEVQPNSPEVHSNLGIAFLQQGQTDQAVAHFEAALAIQPGNVGVLNNLARLLATAPQTSLRNGAKAVELARQAVELTGGDNPVVVSTLAAAYAEAGRFPEAIATARRALELADFQKNSSQAELLRAQIGLYEAGLPFHDSSLTGGPARGAQPGPPPRGR